MSDILVMDRNDKLHIVDYCSPSGNKYALCGHMYVKSDIITTLAIDMSIDIVCRKCHEMFIEMYESDLEDEPQTARGNLQTRLKENYDNIQSRAWDTKAKYNDTVEGKYWYTLNHLRRKSQRK